MREKKFVNSRVQYDPAQQVWLFKSLMADVGNLTRMFTYALSCFHKRRNMKQRMQVCGGVAFQHRHTLSARPFVVFLPSFAISLIMLRACLLRRRYIYRHCLLIFSGSHSKKCFWTTAASTVKVCYQSRKNSRIDLDENRHTDGL